MLDEIKREKLPPNYSRFIEALRNVGYSFEEAVSDIIDNSIDAKATVVHLRFINKGSKGVDLLIVDDGGGMSPPELREAMIFGADPPESQEKRLGLFGLGLKLASIAHAESLFVVSLQEQQLSGRAWTDDGLKEGFFCEVLTEKQQREIASLSKTPYSKGHGTWVYWDRLFRFEDKFGDPGSLCEELTNSLRKYLGLHLHRLLSKTSITIDILDQETGDLGPIRTVDALDPFGYHNPGSVSFPQILNSPGDWEERLRIEAHIWPANSKQREYKLPGGANKRQGLYFYRNNRLLSAGGWHGIREEESHTSLARVAIELEVDVERQASVDVRKARVKLTPEMRNAIEKSISENGVTFSQYVSRANKVYRGAEKKNPKSFPLIPDGGYPADLARKLGDMLDHGNNGHARKFDFKWYDFEEGKDLFFFVDREQQIIWINECFRELFRSGERLSKNDGILVKTLLFIMLRDFLDSERMTKKKQAYLDELGKMLAAAAKAELKRSKLT